MPNSLDLCTWHPVYGSYSEVSGANALTLCQLLNQAIGAGAGACSYISPPVAGELADQRIWEDKIVALAKSIRLQKQERMNALKQRYNEGEGSAYPSTLTTYRSDYETTQGAIVTTLSAPYRA